ncbi:26S proteasome regulatory subunit Rpn5p [[Candida] railenensis]|uniref:26S proteasome regulatory subunit Rpn5p n=1 Tax=[Candida] railenensis TaxID=45579 RepID=A0A9P0QNA3_9ASCO|nr:26S proteasome regulatory subunit Rpn5p [[Candida] railenensis]
MSREDPLKAEKDFSATLDEQFPIIAELSDYKQAIDKYLVLEKQTRQSSDLESSKRLLVKIVDTLAEHRDWNYLNDLILTLSKKHGQLKSSIQTLIQQVISKLESKDYFNDDDKEQLDWKIKLIETIRTVSDKKIFVEVEMATVSKMLSEIHLHKFNDLDKACSILCDLQVETYSLMPFSDKVEYILEQIRLTLKKGDYSQGRILSRKILLKTLKGFEKAEQYKSEYLQYLIDIDVFEHDYLSIVKNSLLLIDLDVIKADSTRYANILTAIVYYVILSPYDNLQRDLIHKIKLDENHKFTKNISSKVFALLETFTTNELIHWSNIERSYKLEFFDKSEIFASNETNYKNLEKRIIEHNLRIINKYYQCIKIDRLAYLLQLSVSESEVYVSELVNKGMISAKINRPEGIIRFENFEQHNSSSGGDGAKNVNELLNSWCYDVDKLLEEIDVIGHLINKEEMMNGIKVK